MHLWSQSKQFMRLFVLRAKPNDLPHSYKLLVVLSVLWLLLKSMLYLWYIDIIDQIDVGDVIQLSYLSGVFIAAVWLLVLFAVMRTALTYLHLLGRYVQTVIAFIAVDCFLAVLFLLWLSALVFIDLPLQTGNIGIIAIVLGFILMMYWQFMVYIHILTCSMNLSLIKSGVFALLYMILQHNLSELLLNIFIKVIEV